MQESWNFLKHFILLLAHRIPISLSLSGNFRDLNAISYITGGILVHGLHFYTAKEFLSSLQFFFSRRVIAVPSLEEMYPREREATLGKEQWKQGQGERVKWGEVWGNKMFKKIRNVAWLGNLMNIESIIILLEHHYLVWMWIRGMGIREEKKDFAIFLKI